MAIADLFDRIGGTSTDDDDDDLSYSAPDDLSGLDDDAQDPGDLLPRDPKPKRKNSGARFSGGATERVTAAQKRRVADALTMLITLPGGAWALRDPCGQALLGQRDDIVKALVPIVCRNPQMLAWFTAGGGGWMDWIALFSALQPVGAAVWSHHVKKSDPAKGGRAAPGGGDPIDLTQYTAA